MVEQDEMEQDMVEQDEMEQDMVEQDQMEYGETTNQKYSNPLQSADWLVKMSGLANSRVSLLVWIINTFPGEEPPWRLWPVVLPSLLQQFQQPAKTDTKHS